MEQKEIVPLWVWDLAVALVIVGASSFGVLEGLSENPVWASEQPDAVRLGVILAPLVFIALLYIVVGRRALRAGLADAEESRIHSNLFLSGLVLLLFAAVVAVPMMAVLQTLVYPMAWAISRTYRKAVLWSAAIAFAAGFGLFLALVQRDFLMALANGAITGTLSFLFAVAMGTWITRIATRGERYRDLAEELRATQAEVAELSAAAGASAERERLSRELHDTLTQTLTGLVMLSEQAERALDAGDAAQGRERLGRVGAAAREAVSEARALVATTQPLGDGGLEASIERVARRLASDTGLHVACEIGPVRLDREREVVLLRAAQEGLANARKHAHATSVKVILSSDAASAILRVEDDGVGPDATASELGGFGLSGLADRVRAVGGQVEFGPGEHGGAALKVRVPRHEGES